MSSYSKRMAEFAAHLQYESIPQEVVEKAKLELLDSVGIAFTSTAEAFARTVIETFGGLGFNKESTIIGTAQTSSKEYAACASGALIHGVDFDDTHIPGIVHPSSCVVPTVLACGEAKGISGKEAIEAIVLGYEIITRIGMAANGKFHDRGFHATPLCGPFAASLISGKIQGHNISQFVNAMGICGSMGGGIQQFLIDGTWVKKLHPGWAAHSGMIASEMASHGFTGPLEVFEGILGFFSAYLGLKNCRLEHLTEGLGETWETLRIVIKPYPSCHFTHSFIDCALHLKEKHHIDFRDIKHIICRISPRGALIVCEPIENRRRVTTSYGGRFSLPYTVALALVEGKVGLEQFADQYLSDDRIIAVASLVDYVKDENLSNEVEHFPGDLTIEMKSGKKYHRSQRFERGSRENPMKEREVIRKFRNNIATAGVTDKRCIEEIIRVVRNLETISDIRELMFILRGSAPATT